MKQSHDQFLWRRAAELLDIERLLVGEPQEVSGNYDGSSSDCPLFADLGTGAMRALDVSLPARRVEAGIRLLAASAGKTIERDDPFLNLILPNGARFSACLPPASHGPTFSIRMHWRPIRPLAEFIGEPSQLDAIDQAIQQRDNIVVVGATSAGKTTLLNAFVGRLIDLFPQERLGVIEDEPELQIEARNCIRRVAHGKANMRRHVREMLRMRPDRIIVGEVRGGEALDLLKVWNTGHSGGFTTLHANNARAGLLRLESLTEEAGVAANPRLIAESVNLVIFIGRRPDGTRRIVEMVRVEGYAPDGGYQLRRIATAEEHA
ncbi:MAG TPA: ATPase, T2SS/T4P/T4SS family [Candidatus Binataceae bacterium]|nr:ATPase, T2SS/T4P/T4SS family [Candidatus Binataceae bacterium]